MTHETNIQELSSKFENDLKKEENIFKKVRFLCQNKQYHRNNKSYLQILLLV